MNINFFPKTLARLSILLLISGCALNTPVAEDADTSPVDDSAEFSDNTAKVTTVVAQRHVPTHFGDTDLITALSVSELRQMNLVSTNLVSVLLQVPELEPINTTFQITKPTSAFGNVLVRAMEDAGIALQLVSSDQGSHYVSYGQSFSITDTGSVHVFSVSVNDVDISRNFVLKSDGIFPASLVTIDGSRFTDQIQIDDSIFVAQGGDDSFVSGIRTQDASQSTIAEVTVNEYDRIPLDKLTPRESVIEEARRRFFLTDTERSPPDLSNFERYRRSVLIFEEKSSMMLGDANKQSLRLLVREFEDNHLIMVKACNDVDGVNNLAEDRAIRVEEEFLAYRIPISSVFLAPCVQSNYRHPADNSPVPVEVVHYRPKENQS